VLAVMTQTTEPVTAWLYFCDRTHPQWMLNVSGDFTAPVFPFSMDDDDDDEGDREYYVPSCDECELDICDQCFQEA
jgi:hypothetical protein